MKQEEVNAIVEKLVSNGAEVVRNVTLGITRVKEEISSKTGEPYYVVSMATEEPIKIKVQDTNGKWVDGTINNVMELFSNMTGVFKASKIFKLIVSVVERSPEKMEIVLPNSVCDIIIQPVKKGEIYKNPFSTSNSEGSIVEHDTYYHHVINLRATEDSKPYIDQLIFNRR